MGFYCILNNRGLSLVLLHKKQDTVSLKRILLVSFSCALWSGIYLKFDSLIALLSRVYTEWTFKVTTLTRIPIGDEVLNVSNVYSLNKG